MSPFKTGKEKISLNEIKNILQSNLKLYMSIYKNDPDFLDYFIDLTLYLLRFKYDKSDDLFGPNAEGEDELPEPERRILQSGLIVSEDSSKPKCCNFCGEELHGKHECPRCGNVTI